MTSPTQNAPSEDATERAVSDALFALLCDCPEEGVCRPECAANNNYIDLGPLAIQALRSLPVEQRMEAMGMALVEVSNDAGEPWRACWVEVLNGDAIVAAAEKATGICTICGFDFRALGLDECTVCKAARSFLR